MARFRTPRPRWLAEAEDWFVRALARPAGRDGVCLVYGDAQQFIGPANASVDRGAHSLEDVVLRCVLTGTPSVASVRFVLFELLERLGRLLYHHNYDDTPNPSGPHFRIA